MPENPFRSPRIPSYELSESQHPQNTALCKIDPPPEHRDREVGSSKTVARIFSKGNLPSIVIRHLRRLVLGSIFASRDPLKDRWLRDPCAFLRELRRGLRISSCQGRHSYHPCFSKELLGFFAYQSLQWFVAARTSTRRKGSPFSVGSHQAPPLQDRCW